MAKDANFDGAQEAKVLTSFDHDLLIFWGKDSASGVSRDDRVVPGLPNYKAWENKKVLSGLRFELKHLIKDSGDTLENAIQSNLHGEAKDVASAMWANTKAFLNDLATWISEHYSQLSGQAGVKDGPKVWKLVCHCIRAILKLMHEARLPGQGPHALGDKYGSVFWGALQTHRVMQDLASEGFEAHPRLSDILNIHPRDNVVPRSAMDRVLAEMADVKRIAEKAEKTADHALQKALSAKGAKN